MLCYCSSTVLRMKSQVLNYHILLNILIGNKTLKMVHMPKANIGAANFLILTRCIPKNLLYSQEPQNKYHIAQGAQGRDNSDSPGFPVWDGVRQCVLPSPMTTQ